MIVEAQETVSGSKESIWAVVADIEGAAERISAIESIEILERPASGMVGLQWKETRTLFGKTATEVMCITDFEENAFYKTKAESHGSIYISTLRIVPQDGSCMLTMTHETKPQGFLVSLIAVPMGLVFKGMLKKCLVQDLNDIRTAVEKT